MDHTKATLRQRLRTERRALSAEQVAERSAVIMRHVANAPFYQRARRIGLYLPVDNEVDPTSLFHTAAQIGQACFLPVVDPNTRSMDFFPYRPGDPLQPGAFGIPQPVTAPDRAGSLDINDLDLVVQPLIGFDRTGCRLGFGGGYHDRALGARGASPTPIRLGVAYAFQELPSLPHEPHDIRMGWVATEQGLLCCHEAF
ncbi:MAG: 5-formyltetrahydrofolate cyclo-ligase [Magnetococcales bacterium]|nr:5-formyltetrahydrofolate cyclo-ligase [Magnetococcales bacterium]